MMEHVSGDVCLAKTHLNHSDFLFPRGIFQCTQQLHRLVMWNAGAFCSSATCKAISRRKSHSVFVAFYLKKKLISTSLRFLLDCYCSGWLDLQEKKKTKTTKKNTYTHFVSLNAKEKLLNLFTKSVETSSCSAFTHHSLFTVGLRDFTKNEIHWRYSKSMEKSNNTRN